MSIIIAWAQSPQGSGSCQENDVSQSPMGTAESLGPFYLLCAMSQPPSKGSLEYSVSTHASTLSSSELLLMPPWGPFYSP